MWRSAEPQATLRTEILEGDLFTVMEEWRDDPQRVKRAMDTILEIEAEASIE